jgi:hypothetical protein
MLMSIARVSLLPSSAKLRQYRLCSYKENTFPGKAIVFRNGFFAICMYWQKGKL